MPSDNFRKMAQSQLELLANSLTRIDHPSVGKVQSMILYLPQENSYSGQLEFTPAVLYPDPSTERVFIASDAASGQAPTLPKSLSKLPGFSSAPELLPGYPMLPSTTDPGVGVVEEVLCDIRFKTSALSVPLLSGCQTVGVLLVSPTVPLSDNNDDSSSNNDDDDDRNGDNTWTKRDKQQVSLAAQSLSMALNMDNERKMLSEQNTIFRENLSDSLHQMKNPIQALRTYGKILQRQIVETSINNSNNKADVGGTAQLLELAERLMVQSDRVVDMLGPMDSLVEALDSRVMLPPAGSARTGQPMVLWNDQSQPSSSRPSLYFNTTIEKDDFDSTALPATTTSTTTPAAAAAKQPNEISAGLQATVIGDFETEMVFITDVLEPVFDTFRAIASEQGIAFEVLVDDVDDLPGVFVAPKSFREAASNVLDNALKYAVLPKAGSPFSRNPSPSVKVRIFPNDHCHSSGSSSETLSTTTTTPGVTVLVEDNGPGVAQHDRHLIFERGFRSDRTASEVEGQGIGLDISRALLARMGGYLGLADEEDDDNELLLQFTDRLDGAAMILEVTRKPYKSSGR
jgi:signal transduction histidine kinase